MLKIVEIGKFEGDACQDGKHKPGVEIQSYGYHIKLGLQTVRIGLEEHPPLSSFDE